MLYILLYTHILIHIQFYRYWFENIQQIRQINVYSARVQVKTISSGKGFIFF